MKYEDFKDNESLEKMVEELRANGTNVVVGVLDDVKLGPIQFPLAAYFRYQLLRYRIYVGGSSAL